ncbi:hypothetical protein [Bradyrhizobium sp. Arg816]|uniref:hypothetical protein n=1 Tax=Bradyrhizobium sp. Arg816 TaxID=2998491 RepID=UPI00249E77D6|nr:hypothetical protein [Bradyrhizobium sp. Arg816]MDI3567539.1 hypothetical protein [Bradyrhizobium sp. Arg816]
MRSSPSIVPADRLDRDISKTSARAGCAWRETDEADTTSRPCCNLLSARYA